MILRWVRDALAVHGTRGIRVSLLCGVYDPAVSQLTYSTAGHPPPLVRRDGRAVAWAQDATAGIGSPQGFILANGVVTLRPGDAVLLYTNGLVDAVSPDGERFGEDRLARRMERSVGQTSSVLVADLLKTLQKHLRDQPQPDDIAVLAFTLAAR